METPNKEKTEEVISIIEWMIRIGMVVVAIAGSIGAVYFVLSTPEAVKTKIDRYNALEEQKYECRMDGGQLEHFSTRGWVCIKPPKGY